MSNLLTDTLGARNQIGTLTMDISEDWSHYFGVLGGYALAATARATLDCAPDGQRLAAVHGIYVSAPQPGPAQIATQVVHAGGALSSARAQLLQGDRLRIDLTATFTSPNSEAPIFHPGTWQEPELSFDESHPAHSPTDPLWARSLQGRVAVRDLEPWRTVPEGREWIRFRDTAGFDDAPEMATSLAAMVTADLLGYPPVAKFFEGGRWIAPTVDIAVFFHGAIDSGGLYFCESFAREVGNGVALVESRVWSPLGTLLATAFQTMLFREWKRPA